MIYSTDEFIQIAELTDQSDLQFTKQFLDATNKLGGDRRKFVSLLISHWQGEHLDKLLDYFGPDDKETDLYTGLDTDPFDVQELVCEMWEYHGIPFDGLDAEFYRDVLRAKLITIKLPKKLIDKYVKLALKEKL